MKKKNYSIIIVSGATATNKEFVISSRLIKNSIFAFSVLLLIFGFVIFDYLTISFDKEEMERLKISNIEKEKTIGDLTANFETIKSSVNRMEEFKKRISVATGLISPDALNEVGVGGDDMGMEPSAGGTIENVGMNAEFPQIDKTIPTRSNIINSTKKLAEKTRDIEKALIFVRSHIKEQKERLAATPSRWPTRGYLTDPFGPRRHPFTGKRSFHYGQDIATQHGNKVIASADGFVLTAEHSAYLGNVILIDHSFGFQTRYGHLATFNVKEGDRVKRGQVIGYVGNTGRSTAPHLHYEVIFNAKSQNPMNYIFD